MTSRGIASREIDEIIRLFSNVFIMRVTIDELINSESEKQKTDAVLRLLMSSNLMMLIKQCIML